MKTSLIATGAMGLLMAAQAFAADAAKGKENFESNCSVCHNSDSTERKMGPGLKGLFKNAKLANGKAVNEANVTAMINEGGNGMPPFADILTKAEKDDIIAFLKSL
jgi:mono/diheme cytochrome c family protein